VSLVYMPGMEPRGCVGCFVNIITSILLLALVVIIGVVLVVIFGPIVLFLWIAFAMISAIF